jgi:hypothetical protein
MERSGSATGGRRMTTTAKILGKLREISRAV